MTQHGYACINLSTDLATNRGMIRRTFQAKGIEYASQLALQNVRDLSQIISWNNQNNVKVFRMSSALFPWMSEYELCDLPDYKKIANILKGTGQMAMSNNQRLSFHPGPYNQMASSRPDVVTKTIKELNQHSEIMDLMGLPESHMSKINIHVGAAYGDKQASMIRWCNNFSNLNPGTQRRLVVENDDKPNMYTVQDLYDGVYKKIGVPVTFDYLHHFCNPGDLTEQEALELAISTWDTKPCTHYSSSKKLNEDENSMLLAHADYVYEEINDYGHDIDIVLEVKAKDLALFKYRKDYEMILS